MKDLSVDDAELEKPVPRWFRTKAIAVHLYTASGAMLALLIMFAAFQGETMKALLLMFAALVVDGTDGFLARRFRVREALPFFDGTLLDDMVDYMTCAVAPMVLLWSGGYLPAGPSGVVAAALPLLATSYRSCRVNTEADDQFFVGFPNNFNVVAFYAIVFELGPNFLAAVLVVCSLLAFVPIRYVYPSRTIVFRRLTLSLTALWFVSQAIILLEMPDPNPLLLGVFILYLFYYFGLSIYLSGKVITARLNQHESKS